MAHRFMAVALLMSALAAPALANGDAHGAKPEAKKEGEAKKEEPAKPAKPSSLTGNALPHCEPGQYPAGNVCKPAPPGYYAPAETRFLVSCPRGMTSRPGSRAPSECF